MPLTREAYEKVKTHGPYPGMKPMSNDDEKERDLIGGNGLVDSGSFMSMS